MTGGHPDLIFNIITCIMLFLCSGYKLIKVFFENNILLILVSVAYQMCSGFLKQTLSVNLILKMLNVL